MLQLSTKKISLKSDTERGKYARFSRLVPFFACKLPRLKGLLIRVLTGTSYSSSTTNKCRSYGAIHLILCLASTGRSSTLKIACGSNIDDIRWNTTFVANCLYFLENSIIVNSLKFCFEGGGLCFSSPQKKFH